MRVLLFIIFFIIQVRFLSVGQDLVTNNGLAITIQSGMTATIKGSLTNKTMGGNLGTINNSGIITLSENWTNNSANTVFSSNAGIVEFIGTSGGQTIGGTNTTGFYNLTLNNTSGVFPEISFGVGSSIRNIFTMTSGKINLAGNTLTLGNSVTEIGTLTHTNGFMYGGTFNRWFDASSFTVGNAKGFYPLGTDSLDARPAWLGFNSSLTSGGSVSINHLSTYPSGSTAVTYSDNTWGSNTAIEGISNSYWVISVANGFTINGATGNLRFGGYGFGANTLTDLSATLAASTVGTFLPATNENVPLEVNRLVGTTDLSNTWYIGTKNRISSSLPVELLGFNAKCLDQNIVIKWSTASETNNSFFQIERSTDFLNWDVIEMIQGAGNSTSLRKYSIVDSVESSGKYLYYKLKQTDYDGNFKYYGTIVAINCDKNIIGNFITIYPNPSNGLFNSDFKGDKNEIRSVTVYDGMGQIVYSSNIYQPSIDLSNLHSGTYFIRLNTDVTYFTGKVQIQK